MAHIPGLGAAAYTVGSWNKAPAPTLLRSEVTAAGFDFEWRASGTAVYTVTAKGGFRKSAASPGGVQLDELKVHCSCPDGAKQRVATAAAGKLFVCKHGAAALSTVQDPAVRAEEAKQAQLQAQLQAKQAQLQAQLRAKEAAKLAAERATQDKEMPGERERVEYGLKQRDAAAVVELLLAQLRTVDGLRAAATLFPPAVFPPAAIRHCRRCGKDYDLNIAAQRVCQVEHPSEEVSTRWEDSKHCYDECGKCGKTFNLDGYSSFSRRKADPVDDGPFCWEGEHKGEDESSSDEEAEAYDA